MTAWLLCAGALADPTGEQTDAWSPIAAQALARTLLRRGRLTAFTNDEAAVPAELPHEAFLRERFGLDADANPEAFVIRHAVRPPAARPGALVVRPVHLHVGLDHLVLLPPDALGLSRSAAQALADAANAHFSPDEMHLQVVEPDAWLLECTPPCRIRVHGTQVASGRNAADFQPSGPDASRIAALMNELQMLWHEHPVNADRESQGKLTVSSLWIEGAAPLGTPPACRGAPAAVYADQAAVRGLARACGVVRIERTPSTTQTLRAALAQDGALIDLPYWRQAMIERDAAAWAHGWRQFADILSTTLRRASPRTRVRVVLTGERLRAELEWHGTDRLKWWRRTDLALGRDWRLRFDHHGSVRNERGA